jgi:hypothetical protein
MSPFYNFVRKLDTPLKVARMSLLINSIKLNPLASSLKKVISYNTKDLDGPTKEI